ncbi:MAG TPA: hypothetical protein PKL59_20895 [Nitrospira sp.]|jgi:hypothetical protein|nr:hypothetical protein [Nitrospira sp.]
MATEVHIRPIPQFVDTVGVSKWLELNDKLAAFLKASGLYYVAYPNGAAGWTASRNSPSVREAVTEFANKHGYKVNLVNGTISTVGVATLTKS